MVRLGVMVISATKKIDNFVFNVKDEQMNTIDDLKRLMIDNSKSASEIFNLLKKTLADLKQELKQHGMYLSYRTDNVDFIVMLSSDEESCVYSRRQIVISVAHDGVFITIPKYPSGSTSEENAPPPYAKLLKEQITTENIAQSLCQFAEVRLIGDFNKSE